ncbi:MAG TPA: hypothetical protein VE954_23295 [Oligoflexus sp.]|uniref:tetratricopeptide repeat protein n=1 Tax=Oligoflexus sp. TaxID=1971216 RepID=UPI002D44503E|nr:hypothetical protein [Oligoflexus sp.]HYX36038.1 hypothetical protein [Oligoflexus sp.]
MIPNMNRCISLCFTLLVTANFPHANAHNNMDHCTEMAQHGLGHYTLPISTTQPQVQNLFDQGINLAFGFHHEAAEKKFAEAVRLDENCAMCYWGMAYVKGPNINAPMTPEAVPLAWQALTKAKEKINHATPKEQALIRALGERYTNNPMDDRVLLDQAYAKAMKSVAQTYPNDIDIATLAVEAVMDTMPWNYWTPQGEPREGTEEMILTLKRVLEKNPVHPGAIHFLIHVVEKERPELAEAAADRLVDLVPAAGHLVHMASHIYIRVGRYHDASVVNEKAIAADKMLTGMCPGSDDFYRALYVPHNYDFLIASAGLEGRQMTARQTAQELREYIEPMMKSNPLVDFQQFWSMPILSALRFEDWKAVLDEPAPQDAWTYAKGLWHFARAKAYARMGKAEASQAELNQAEKLAQSPELQKALLAGLNPAATVLMIGVEEAKGELAFQKKDYQAAIQHLNRSIAIQDGLTYIEPPAWYHSVRLTLGKVYQSMGRYADAERTFKEDLQYFPKNGWALFGLYKSMVAQNNLVAADQIYDEFVTAWQYADVKAGPDQVEVGL